MLREKQAAEQAQRERQEHDRKHQQDLMRCSLAQIRECFPGDGAYEIIVATPNGYFHKGFMLVVRHAPTQDIVYRCRCIETAPSTEETAAIWEFES